jgi:dephospho-CoA kinase
MDSRQSSKSIKTFTAITTSETKFYDSFMSSSHNPTPHHQNGQSWGHRRLIGLTGGIATGKTTVTNYLASIHQLPILDADRYAREAVQPGSEILQSIVDRYGQTILADGEHLDRPHLGMIVFHDEQERHWLESLIHPYVAQCFQDLLDALKDQPTIVLAIPLLFETKIADDLKALYGHTITETWVVTCSPEQQLHRLMKRDHLSLEEAQARIQAQMPLSEKCARADVVLDNSSTIDALLEQVAQALLKNSAPQQLTSPR